MNRRGFLAMLAAGGVVTAEGLWMPGRKLISIPKPASPLLSGEVLRYEGVTIIKQSLVDAALPAIDGKYFAVVHPSLFEEMRLFVEAPRPRQKPFYVQHRRDRWAR